MHEIALVWAFLLYLGCSRRVQTSIVQLEGNLLTKRKDQDLQRQIRAGGAHDAGKAFGWLPAEFEPAVAFVSSGPGSVAGAGARPTVLSGPKRSGKHISAVGVGSSEAYIQNKPNCATSSAVGLQGRTPSGQRSSQISMSSATTGVSECEGNATTGPTRPEEKDSSWRKSSKLFGFVGLAVAKVFTRIALVFRRRASPRERKGTMFSKIDIPLLICIFLWYLGNYSYNVTNKIALVAAGGVTGFPMTVATVQLGVGVLYALFLWAAPDARPMPRITLKDYRATLPVGASSGAAHAAAVLALSAGAVSFAQIVKSAEPAFAALLGTIAYGARVSTARWLCLIPVILGVALASLGELNFTWLALALAVVSNALSAFKKMERHKLMSTADISERLGSVGNQFAITTITSFFICLPLMLLFEGHKLGTFVQLCETHPDLLSNLIISGFFAYTSSEYATLVIKRTSAVTQSVLATMKRAFVIIVVALVMGESLSLFKLLGCSMSIGGVFLYSMIDDIVAKRAESKARSVRGLDFGVQHYGGMSTACDSADSTKSSTIQLKSKGEEIAMPIAGLGLWKSKPEEVEEAISAALACGVRLLDSAAVYGNEKEVGRAIAANCEKLKIPREDMFIVSKLFNTHHVWNGDVSRVAAACDRTLQDLRVEYVDLYMMHWPYAFLQTDLAAIGGLRLSDGTPNPKLVYHAEFLDTYRELIKLLQAGKCRALGVCNLTQGQLQELIQHFPEYPPSVLQCEFHPYLCQSELVKYCADNGIVVMAYSPLGSGDSYSGRSFPELGAGPFQNPNAGTRLLENPIVAEIASRVGKSRAQVLIRWCVQRNIVCIPKSVKAARIKENYSVLDWTLGDEDVAKLNSLDCGFRYSIGYGPGHYDCPNAPWYSSPATNL